MAAAPTFYDPNSPDEQPVPLPSAPLQTLFPGTPSVILQPPLTRRGTGPGLLVFLPPSSALEPNPKGKPLDPEPVQKWAEEGFAVVGITVPEDESEFGMLEGAVSKGLDALQASKVVDIKDKVAALVYDARAFSAVTSIITSLPRLVCIASYAPLSFYLSSQSTTLPTLFHLSTPNPEDAPTEATKTSSVTTETATYPSTPSPFFVLPNSSFYDPGSASLSHTTTLVFFRKHIGGPIFDIVSIWEEHTYFEFAARTVARTMGTMVAEPYVNHVPTMTGGVGRAKLSAFYRDHFIFSNPADTRMQTVSRTVGPDRVVDEFVLRMTHDRTVDWLLPGVPPTGKQIAVPMLGVINIRGDRLYHEHIWWDQATVLHQVGVLPSHVPWPLPTSSSPSESAPQGVAGQKKLRLPVAIDDASARLLIDKTDGVSNEMFDEGWGVVDA